MTPKYFMTMGAVTGLLMALVSAFINLEFLSLAVIFFGSGMLFGIGYGAWEQRSKGDDDDA